MKQVKEYKIQHHYGKLFMAYYNNEISKQELLDATSNNSLFDYCSSNEQ